MTVVQNKKVSLFIKGTPINCENFYRKHLRFPMLEKGYTYNVNEGIGFFKCVSILGATFLCQVRQGKACYLEVSASGVQYNVDSLDLHSKVSTFFKKECDAAHTKYCESNKVNI